MRILMLAHISPRHPQLVRKFAQQYSSLKKYNKDTICYILSEKPVYTDSGAINIVVPDFSEQVSACLALAEDLCSDVVYYRFTRSDKAIYHFVSQFNNIVIEHHHIEEARLAPHERPAERYWGPRTLSKACGLVGVTREILDYEMERSGGHVPGLVLTNGICIDESPLLPRPRLEKELVLGMAADFHPWQGLDRVLNGLRHYPNAQSIHLHLAGGGNDVPRYLDTARSYGLRVTFHGMLDPDALRTLLASCHVGIGPLARHRTNMRELAPLKHREYAAMGLPFVYAGIDPDFPSSLPFIHNVPSDDVPLDCDALFRFARECASNSDLARQERAYAAEHVSWDAKSVKLLEFLQGIAPLRPIARVTPQLSVIATCHEPALLSECLAALARQNAPDMETVLVGIGVTLSVALVDELTSAYPTLHIRMLESGPNLCAARNTAISASCGTWILLWDENSALSKESLSSLFQSITAPTHANILFLPSGEPILFRRSLWEAVSGYDPNCPPGMEDELFTLNCRQQGCIPLPLSALACTPPCEAPPNGGKHDEILALHRTMRPNCYSLFDVLAGHTRLLHMSGGMEDAVRRKCEEQPELALPWFWLGLAHLGRGERDEALHCFLKVLRLPSSSDKQLVWQAACRLREIYRATGLTAKGRAMQALCLEGRPDFAPLFAVQERCLQLAASYTQAPQGEKPRRILMLEGGEFVGGNSVGVLTLLGEKLRERGYEVHMAAHGLSEREALQRNGVFVHVFPYYADLTPGIPGGLDDFDFIVRHGGFSHIICPALLNGWSLYLGMHAQIQAHLVFLPIAPQDIAEKLQPGILSHVLRLIMNTSQAEL